MHNEVNIPSKKWKCSILHKRCPFFSAEQTVGRWTPLGGLVLPAKIVAKFSVKQMLSRDTFDSTTKKVSLIATYVRENFTQSSCLSTTLDCSTQMQTVRFVIKLSWKVDLMLTKKHTRRMHSSVNHVIKSTIGKTTWKITGRLVEDLWEY